MFLCWNSLITTLITLVFWWFGLLDRYSWIPFWFGFGCYGQELEEREKLVRQMWDVYTHSKTTRLPSFWLEAFEAAYEELTSDVPDARNAAVSEIARMALRSTSFEPLTVQSTVSPTNSPLLFTISSFQLHSSSIFWYNGKWEKTILSQRTLLSYLPPKKE